MEGKYTWTENQDDEIWYNDRFDSIEECIKDAIGQGKKPGDKIAVGICEDYVPHVDVDTLLDRANEEAYEECGDVVGDWPEFIALKGYAYADKLQEKMDKAFNEWLEETHQVPHFYHIYPLSDMVEIRGGEADGKID
jgi:hypothetical protein